MWWPSVLVIPLIKVRAKTKVDIRVDFPPTVEVGDPGQAMVDAKKYAAISTNFLVTDDMIDGVIISKPEVINGKAIEKSTKNLSFGRLRRAGAGQNRKAGKLC